MKFKTNDYSNWQAFQSGQSLGVRAANMSTFVQIAHFQTGELLYNADVSNCK